MVYSGNRGIICWPEFQYGSGLTYYGNPVSTIEPYLMGLSSARSVKQILYRKLFRRDFQTYKTNACRIFPGRADLYTTVWEWQTKDGDRFFSRDFVTKES